MAAGIVAMTDEAAFFRLYEGLPRQGPGSEAGTREALRRLPRLPARPRILDLGCGSGASSLVLAEALGAKVIAVDRHRPFLDQLEASARARGLGALIETRLADMAALELAPASVDLLWSEGAIYLLGFEAGLRLWRPWLTPGGVMAVTECSWLTDRRPPEAAAFWREAYPAIGDVATNARRAESAGFELLDWFALPPTAWWDAYYTPLLRRMPELASGAGPALAAEIAATEREIDLYRRHGDSYGYVFYLLRRPA